jgi:hypothetical protein
MVLAAAVGVFVMPANAADLALKRVVLSNGGVGYFEYEAQVDGDAALTLDVPLEQVDDVLKSLVVYDAGGTLGEVTLPGRAPLTQSFVDLPFDRSALNSATDLLNALQGAEIRIAGPRRLDGRLLHVDQDVATGPAGLAETRWRVSLMTDAGLQQIALRDIEAIEFADPELRRQIDTALSRIAGYRATGRRRLTIRTRGAAARNLRLSYVVAMPVWKPSYRLTLPADAQANAARLQGWAVLENFSGQPWKDVELTLLSGNPVTFRQALYESYYVPRPTVPVEAGELVLPPPDTGAVPAAAPANAAGARDEARSPYQRGMSPRAESAPMAAKMAPSAPSPPPPAPPPPAPLAQASVAEEATQVAFTAPDKVTVAAGQSLMLPLLDRELPARRVDLYQPEVNPRHPLAAVELTNASGAALPPGVLTLYRQDADRGSVYLGDARLAALPAGDKRLLSYALDGKTTIDRSTAERRPIVTASIADGAMRIGRVVRWTTTYRVKSAGEAGRLLIEQPRRGGAKLVSPDPQTVELTPKAYRIPADLPADGGRMLAVVEETPVEETIRLLDTDDDRIGVLIGSAELDPKMRQALTELLSRRREVGRRHAELDRLAAQRARLVEDEQRVRANLAAVGGDPAMRKRQLDKLSETEAAIDALTGTIDKDSAELATAERNLADYVNSLTL